MVQFLLWFEIFKAVKFVFSFVSDDGSESPHPPKKN